MGGLFDETVGLAAPQDPPPMLVQIVTRLVCRVRGHRWQRYGRPMRYGRREWCTCCEANRVLLTTSADPDAPDAVYRIVEASVGEVCAADRRFAEALYEARWGDRPVQRMRRGEWPAP